MLNESYKLWLSSLFSQKYLNHQLQKVQPAIRNIFHMMNTQFYQEPRILSYFVSSASQTKEKKSTDDSISIFYLILPLCIKYSFLLQVTRFLMLNPRAKLLLKPFLPFIKPFLTFRNQTHLVLILPLLCSQTKQI